MLRSLLCLGIALTVVSPCVASDASPKNPPMQFDSGAGNVGLTTTVVGVDLSLTYEFADPVKGYLTADNPFLSIELQIDSDNNAKTGWAQVDDLRRGSEFSINIILRAPGQGKGEETIVSRWGIDPKYGWVGNIIKTDARLRVDGNQVRLLVPLSAFGFKKGQEIRIIPVAQGRDVAIDQTLHLR